MKLAKRARAGAFYLGSVLVIHAVVLWSARDLIRKGYPDFTIYYTAGTMVREGMGPCLYDDAVQFGVQRDFAPQVATRRGALPFNHPPFEAIVFVPFSYLSYRVAYLVWALVNLTMLATLPRLLRPFVPVLGKWHGAVWMLAGLGFFPVFFSWLQGQDAILLLFLYALAFVSLKKGCFLAAGAWLACGLFKFHLVLPCFLLLLIQQKALRPVKRMLGGFMLVGALLGVLSVAIVGVQQMIAYPRYVLGLEATMARGAIMPSDMPNLRGILYLIFARLPDFNVLVVVLSAILFVVAMWISRQPNGDPHDLKFSLAVFAAVLVSYHGLGYDLCVLALPLLILAGWLQKEPGGDMWTRFAMLAGMAGLLCSPLQLVLLMRYNRLGWIGWAVLLCFLAVLAEERSRNRRVTA
jgi:glycosyl transferase family 87